MILQEKCGKISWLNPGINEIMAEGSVICFDYPTVDESSETKKNQMLASGAGKQMQAPVGVAYVMAMKI